MRNKKFLRLVALFAAYVWFNTFSKAILPVYFIKHGFLPSQIIFGAFLFYFAIALFVVLFRNFKAKTGWYLAVVFQLLYMLLLLNISSTYVLYFASFISGIATFFFYIPYNIAHYENTPENKNGISSSIMTNMWPVIGMAAPLLAGFLAQYNYSLIWIFTAIFFRSLKRMATPRARRFSRIRTIGAAMRVPWLRVWLNWSPRRAQNRQRAKFLLWRTVLADLC